MIYNPKEDSYLLSEEVKKSAGNKKVLDVGSGSGIQSETALNAGAKSVLASDINPESINLLKSKNIPCIQSDLFRKIKGKFDLIVFNPPYLPRDEREDKHSRTATTGGKKGDEIILRFLNQAVHHLKSNGIILIILSSLTPKNKINKTLKKLNLQKEILSQKKLFMETLEVWKIVALDQSDII